ncbi:hypothetical protein HF319_15375 [Xanthomonas sp. Kuri4-1]
MKTVSSLAGLCLFVLLLPAVGRAQPPGCPSLPPAAGLQWTPLAGDDYLVCKASTADGRQVLGLMLTTRDPDIALGRDRRAEKGQIEQTPMYWYRLDLGGGVLPNMASRRIAVVELGKHRYAQIWIDAGDSGELASLQSLLQHMDLEPASLALTR